MARTLVGITLVLVLGGLLPGAVAEESTFPLTVRDGKTRRPIAGATVHVVVPEVLRALRLDPRFDQQDLGRLAEIYGEAVTADAEGVARVPRAALESGWCVVQEEDRFGALSVYDPDLEEHHELEVFPDMTIRLRVTGPDGLPVGGIPLSLRRPGKDTYPYLWRGVTAAESGEVLATQVDWRLRRAHVGSCIAVLEVPGTDVRTPIPWPPESDEAVVLRLPPTGRVRITPKGPGAAGRIRLTLREDPLAQWAPSIEQDGTDGAATTFPHVGLGRSYRLDVFPFDRRYRKLEPLVFAGPSEAGEEVVAAPVVEALNVLLAGRVVDEQGEPVVARSFHAWLEMGGGSALSTVTTDGEGRFQYVVDVFGGATSGGAVLELVPEDRGMGGDSRVRLELRLPLPDGTTDVGDVVLPSAPTVLSGTVVDTAGEPVPEVYVFVCQGRAPTEQEASHRWLSTQPVASDEKDEDPTWIWSPQLRATTDAEGRFRVTGELLEGQPCRFAIYRPGYVMRAPQVARPGATDERLVLERTGRLEGAIRLGPDVDPKCLWLVLRGRPAARDALEPTAWNAKDPPPDDVGEVVNNPGWVVLGQVTVPARDGVQPFVFTGLRPGVATLAVCIGDDPDPIADFEGIEITEGEVCRAAGCDPLDARGLVRRIRLTLEDHSGTLPPGTEVREFLGHGRQTARLITPTLPSAGGSVAVTLRAGTTSRVDVEVRAPGRRAARIEDARGDLPVRLGPGIPVRVTLPSGWDDDLSGQAVLYAGTVHPEGVRFFRFLTDGVSAGVAAGDTDTHLVLPLPGPWLLTLRADGAVKATATVQVRDDAAEEQVFAIE